jgi:hypothetical protein
MRNLSTTLGATSALASIRLGFDATDPASGGDTTTGDAPAADSPADAPAQTDAAKPKLTIDLVPERRTFATLELAGAALAAIAEQSSDFDSVTIVAPGASFNDEGEFVPEAPEWTAETHEIMLAPLATKAVKAAADGPNGVKAGDVIKPAKLIALVFTPIPTLDALTTDDKGLAMVAEVIRKELNHRAVRKLRTAENVLAAASEMPLSIESFATAQTGGASGLAAFDDHWLLYSQALAKHKTVGPVWGARFPGGKGKPAIRAAIENAAKAKALFPELEAFGPEGKETSLFVRLLQGVIKAATEAGQDTTLLQAWLDTRDQQTYEPGSEAAQSDDLDFDTLFDDMAPGESEGTDGDGTDDGDPPTATDATGEAETSE